MHLNALLAYKLDLGVFKSNITTIQWVAAKGVRLVEVVEHLLFSGYIVPANPDMVIPGYLHRVGIGDNADVLAELEIEIKNSLVTASFRSPIRADVGYEGWRNSLQPIIASIVDSYGFLTGGGHDVEISQVKNVIKGEIYRFPIWLVFLREKEVEVDFHEKFLQITRLTEQPEGRYFMQALAELRKAVRNPFESPLHAFKAVESIRHIYTLKDGLDPLHDRAAGWKAMREDLGITREFIADNFEDLSKRVRHGEIVEFSQEGREQLLTAAWALVRRYVEVHR